MIELIIVVALILLVRFWINPRNKKKNSAVEKENNSGKHIRNKYYWQKYFCIKFKRTNTSTY